ncbi:MAG: hydrogenase [Promethearchaeota archaeon]
MEKPKIGIYSLTGCGGEALMILNMEDALLDLLSKFDIKSFQEGSSYEEDVELDIAFVEGSVSTETHLEKLKKIREKSKLLVALGDCAIGGCVQAMRNQQMSIAEKMKKVYGVEETYYDALEPKGLSAHVNVDLEIPGCPIEKEETFRAITSLLHGDVPEQIDYPVCVECKRKEYPCVLVEKNMPCLGPIIVAGCDARCPGLGLDCIGCRGPIKDETNAAAELDILLEKGYDKEDISNRLRIFCGNFEDIQKITKGISQKSK